MYYLCCVNVVFIVVVVVIIVLLTFLVVVLPTSFSLDLLLGVLRNIRLYRHGSRLRLPENSHNFVFGSSTTRE